MELFIQLFYAFLLAIWPLVIEWLTTVIDNVTTNQVGVNLNS